MALLDISFTEQEIAEAGKYDLIPAGNYVAQVIKSELKQNANGNGNRLSLYFQIIEGELRGRTLYQDITIRNTNETAMKIGREQMAEIAKACNLTKIGDSSEIHNVPMQIRVAIREDKTGQYDPRNEIRKFASHGAAANRPAGGFAPPKPPVAAAPAPAPVATSIASPSPAPAAAPGTAGGMPWRRAPAQSA